MDWGVGVVPVPRRLLCELLEDGICPLHLRLQLHRLLLASSNSERAEFGQEDALGWQALTASGGESSFTEAREGDASGSSQVASGCRLFRGPQRFTPRIEQHVHKRRTERRQQQQEEEQQLQEQLQQQQEEQQREQQDHTQQQDQMQLQDQQDQLQPQDQVQHLELAQQQEQQQAQQEFEPEQLNADQQQPEPQQHDTQGSPEEHLTEQDTDQQLEQEPGEQNQQVEEEIHEPEQPLAALELGQPEAQAGPQQTEAATVPAQPEDDPTLDLPETTEQEVQPEAVGEPGQPAFATGPEQPESDADAGPEQLQAAPADLDQHGEPAQAVQVEEAVETGPVPEEDPLDLLTLEERAFEYQCDQEDRFEQQKLQLDICRKEGKIPMGDENSFPSCLQPTCLVLVVCGLPLADVLALRAVSTSSLQWAMHGAITQLGEVCQAHQRIRTRLWIQRLEEINSINADETVFESKVRRLADDALRRRMEAEMADARQDMENRIRDFHVEVDRRMEAQAVRVHAIVEERVQQQLDSILAAEMEKVRILVEERVQGRVRQVVQREVYATVCEMQAKLASLAKENEKLRTVFLEHLDHSDLCFRSLVWSLSPNSTGLFARTLRMIWCCRRRFTRFSAWMLGVPLDRRRDNLRTRLDMMHQFGELRQRLSDHEREEEATRQRAITAQDQPQDGEDPEHAAQEESEACEQPLDTVSTQTAAAAEAAVLLQEEAPLQHRQQQQHELTPEVADKARSETSVASGGGGGTEELPPKQASSRSQAGEEDSDDDDARLTEPSSDYDTGDLVLDEDPILMGEDVEEKLDASEHSIHEEGLLPPESAPTATDLRHQDEAEFHDLEEQEDEEKDDEEEEEEDHFQELD